ncbi:MAG: S1 RNA-binding domain-containing protein, partial [Oscillospiraceae bacterium]|nr:S1 RNA-binding domain-containing protein [Oscillospiraceae bacterium]
MEHTVGEVLEGKVKSLTTFGAFIQFADGATGLVHISEIAHTFVSDIRAHLTEGDTVKV